MFHFVITKMTRKIKHITPGKTFKTSKGRQVMMMSSGGSRSNMLVGHSNRQFNRFDFLYSGAFWVWPLPIYILFIQIHSLSWLAGPGQAYIAYRPTDLLHGHSSYSDIETNHDHCPIASIFCESQCLLQMQLEIWDSCFILFRFYRPKDI